MGPDRKGMVSMVGCVVGIGVATVATKLAFVVFVAVAVMWLMPDRRIERYLAASDVTPTYDS